jgi:predicted membrane-bound dolichyl-phosphate-mannose-protein mannosyltransferase
MNRRLGLLMLVPALSFSLFLSEVLRRHGYQALDTPLALAAAVLAVTTLVFGLWASYSLFLSRFVPMGLRQALRLDLLCHAPMLLCLAYFVPAISSILNVGTLLFFSAVAGTVACKVAVLAYYRRAELETVASHPYLLLALVVTLAAVLRVSLIATNRFHGDEALYSHWGLLIASGEDLFLRQGVIVDKPPVFLYTLALFFKVFGPTEIAARLPNVISSLASMVIVYHIALTLSNRRVALLSAVFIAFSPFDAQFAPTAFTDPLMVFLALVSFLLALKQRHLWAGVTIGLAVMTKPTALFFAPLLLFFTAVPFGAEWRGRRLGLALLRVGLGFLAVCLAVVCWDVVIRLNCVNFLTASASRYGGLRLVPLERVVPRLQGWLRQLHYLTGSRILDGVLVVGLPLLLGLGLWRRARSSTWLLDWALAAFLVYFVAVHTLLSFSVWDRYMLGLVPVVAILLARVLLLPLDLLVDRASHEKRTTVVYLVLLGVLLSAVLVAPTQVAARYGFPVGGDHGAFQGIDDVADYFRANAPPGSIVFHKWLAWHYSFYMFDLPLEYYWYPDHSFVLDSAEKTPHLNKYVVFPSWTSEAELREVLNGGGWGLTELYRTYRPDGTMSFTIYQIQPLDQ